MNDALEAARRWAAARYMRISSFAVCRLALTRRSIGARYIEAEFASLDEARASARRYAREVRGGRRTICALTPEGWAFQFEELTAE